MTPRLITSRVTLALLWLLAIALFAVFACAGAAASSGVEGVVLTLFGTLFLASAIVPTLSHRSYVRTLALTGEA